MRKNLRALYFGIFLSFVIISILEGAFRLNRHHPFLPPPDKRQLEPNSRVQSLRLLKGLDLSFLEDEALNTPSYFYVEPDEELDTTLDKYPEDFYAGPRPRAGQTVRSRAGLAKSERVIFDVEISVDSYSRRFVPRQPAVGKEGFLIFLGCSFTFGVGCSDDHTMPAFAQRMLPDHRIYNFGCMGYGPNDILRNFQAPGILHHRGVEEKTGIIVYTYITNHFNRLLGSLTCVRDEWSGGKDGGQEGVGVDKPFYRLDADRSALRDGSFRTGRPFRTRLYQLLGKSELVRYFHVELPRVGDDQITLFAEVMGEIKRLAEQKFGARHFYMVIYPGHVLPDDMVIPVLKKKGIRILDYSFLAIDKLLGGRNIFPVESHPTPLTHRLLSELIVRDLRRDGVVDEWDRT